MTTSTVPIPGPHHYGFGAHGPDDWPTMTQHLDDAWPWELKGVDYQDRDYVAYDVGFDYGFLDADDALAQAIRAVTEELEVDDCGFLLGPDDNEGLDRSTYDRLVERAAIRLLWGYRHLPKG